MTNGEIQEFLDVLLPYSDKQKRSKTANNKLNTEQNNKLYNIAKTMCSGKILSIKNGGKIIQSIEKIEVILNSIGYNQNMTKTVRKDKNGNIIYGKRKNNITTVTSGYTNMPFLIKQVLYLLSVRVMQFEIPGLSPKDIFEDMYSDGIKISHNFFSNSFGKITPVKYYRCINYHQPKNPIKYMGQKKGRLGIAIKHLVMQSVASFRYDTFVDVFGGSSSATVAPVYKKQVTYVYNDLDPLIINYVKVLTSDTLYKDFICALKKIQTVVYSGGQEDIDYDYINDIIPRDIEQYIDKPIGKKKNHHPKTVKRMEKILELGMREVIFQPNEIINFLNDFQQIIVPHVTEEDLSRPFMVNLCGTEKNYTLQEIQQFSNVSDYTLHYRVIRFLLDTHKNNIKEPYSYAEKKDLSTIQEEFRRFRVLGILIRCKDLYYNNYNQNGWKPKSKEEMVMAAAVLLIFHYFSVSLDKGSDSSITSDFENKAKKHYFDRFCAEDFGGLIEDYHKSLRRLKEKNIENMDCINLINNYGKDKDKKVLFYVDSPYVETTAYEKNDKRWSTKEMEDLIDALFDCGQKFIFSMRACKEAKSLEKERTKTQVLKTNSAILEVFRQFSHHQKEKKQDLYVLAVDFDMDELEERIINTQQCEIMLTNYPIQSFYDIGDKINAAFIRKSVYKVLKFDEFFNCAEGALEALDATIYID